MYFNYHAKAKRLIESGEAEYYEIVENYHGISPCLLIHFKDDFVMPIRQHKFDEYKFLLAKNNVKEK